MISVKESIAFNGHRKEWNDFRLICKLKDTNASYEVRHFIARYIQDNIELLEDYNRVQEEIREEWIQGDLD